MKGAVIATMSFLSLSGCIPGGVNEAALIDDLSAIPLVDRAEVAQGSSGLPTNKWTTVLVWSAAETPGEVAEVVSQVLATTAATGPRASTTYNFQFNTVEVAGVDAGPLYDPQTARPFDAIGLDTSAFPSLGAEGRRARFHLSGADLAAWYESRQQG